MIAIIWMINFVLKVELSIQNFILILLMIGFNSFLTVSDVFLHLFEESICGLTLPLSWHSLDGDYNLWNAPLLKIKSSETFYLLGFQSFAEVGSRFELLYAVLQTAA